MKRTLTTLLGALILGGCSTWPAIERPLAFEATVTEAMVIVALDFTNASHIDQRLLVRVLTPANMTGEILAISVQDGWGKEIRFHGNPNDWTMKVGTVLRFEVDSRDIKNGWTSLPRRIDANKIRNLKMPNRVAGGRT